jgi:ribonuclease HII
MQYAFNDDFEEIQVGLDEAGRGSLAGSVTVAAVIWDPNIHDKQSDMIKDSKKLSKKKRESLRHYIEENAVAYHVEHVSNEIIDEINVSQATMLGMHRCLTEIDKKKRFERILVDGNYFKPFMCHIHNCVEKGDNKYISIAAASILAKVHHDEVVKELLVEIPDADDKYGWSSNMCYGTPRHLAGIVEHGLTKYHRRSFCSKYLTT